jgi:hypothetical protein
VQFRSFLRDNHVMGSVLPEYESKDCYTYRAGSTFEGFHCFSDFVDALQEFLKEHVCERVGSRKRTKRRKVCEQ